MLFAYVRYSFHKNEKTFLPSCNAMKSAKLRKEKIMALLQLKDIGKIYVSESNVTVGIRGVNLSFDKGEFVAITGKSGSGKSTLLNVISGMDSYEEGELFIEGQPTSHYLQPEWEEYREEYISFIFQDYNIIDSLTVLQNVELALMHIDDTKERRKRALDLIHRVGLTSHMKHKGSKLSGGQKQRTVIARALAKDSPIILADEPTGNLDSRTSAEIIELLKEVSADKLLIVVTHNFEQVEEHATRHVRIFDGAVESDTVTRKPETAETSKKEGNKAKKISKKGEWKKDLKNGLILGKTIFSAKPRLSLFLCLLMIIGMFGVFMITTLSGDMGELFAPHYMFTHIDGRLIVTAQDGKAISEEQVKALAEKYGAKKYLRVDSLLDTGFTLFTYPDEGYDHFLFVNPIFGEYFGEPDVGSYPTEKNEVFLYLPISYQDDFGKEALLIDEIKLQELPLKVTGVRYYYDNNLPAKCLFTEEGLNVITAIEYILNRSNNNCLLTLTSPDMTQTYGLYNMITDFDMPADKIYINEQYFTNAAGGTDTLKAELTFSTVYTHYGDRTETVTFSKKFGSDFIVPHCMDHKENGMYIASDIMISDELLSEIATEILDRSYTQVSLFFENDKKAHEVAEVMQADGYIAVPSDTEYIPGAEEAILGVIGGLASAFTWFFSIVFLAFFINLCSGRALGAFKGDMAIMRSMGIPVHVIRIAMYTRMMLALIPAFFFMLTTAVLIFTSPAMNEFFVYLYPPQYAAIILGMILLTVNITQRQVRRLFSESVQKSLKGDTAQ